MQNLHRSLAPISTSAWAEIEQEARRTFTSRIAGRKAVDVPEAGGLELSAVTTGHIAPVASPVPDVLAHRRDVQPLVELRVPFSVDRQAIDDVARGAQDSDWDPVKAAAEKLAAAEDALVFSGSQELGITGICPGSSNPVIELPESPADAPSAVASALTTLRSVGVAGPYALLLSSELYTVVSEASHHGYPIRDHIARIVGDEGSIVYAPALNGAVMVSLRGGDYTLQLGQDVSIGYLSHSDSQVELYLTESLTFQNNTAEAAVVFR